MGITELILSLVTAVLGCTTLLSWILYGKANKRLKEAEVKVKEAEVKAAEIRNEHSIRDGYEESLSDMRQEHAERTKELRATIADVNLMYHNAIKDGARKDGIIEDKVKEIRKHKELLLQAEADKLEYQKKINRRESYIAALLRYTDYLKNWHCERELPQPCDTEADLQERCTRRKPAHQIPLRYEPYDMALVDEAQYGDE